MEVSDKKTAPDETLTLPESTSTDQPAPLPQGDRSRYVLLHEHGRGGLGRVLLAHDQALDRQVAVKISISDSPRAQARFAQEARITARLQHPGIVPVHDAGIWSNGQPYCAMKFIAGRSLRDLLRELHDDFEERLALLPKIAAVAEALAYAHDQGIVHRDIKPSNIMVGDFGETIIVDWGIAIDQSENPEPQPPKESGAVAGTRGYMAPEQARGERVDARADVFALGVVIYETLGGRPPGKEASRVRAVEPRIPLELEAIIAKAMSDDPANRYADAGELGHDLRAYLNGQLVRAHRYSWHQRASRRIRKHRRALLGVLVAGLAGTTVFGIVHARNSGPSCSVSPSELAGVWDGATQARVRAALTALAPDDTNAFTRVAAQLNQKRDQWLQMRREVCEATHVRGTQPQQVFDQRMECLDRRRSEMAALTARMQTPPPNTSPRAFLPAVLHLPAISACADTAALQTQSPLPEGIDAQGRIHDLNAKLDDANALRKLGHDKDALARMDALVEPVRALKYPPLLAELLRSRGQTMENLGDFESARTAYQDASSEAARGGNMAGMARSQIQLLLLVVDRLREQKQAALIEPLTKASAALVPNDSATQAKWHEVLGVIAWHAGDYDQAISEYGQALAIVKRIPDHDVTLEGSLLNDLGMSYRNNGDLDRAEQYYKQSIVLSEKVYGPDSLDEAATLNNLGVLEESRGNVNRALEYNQHALRIKRKAYGDFHRSVSRSLSNIGVDYERLGQMDEAEKYLRKALETSIKVAGGEDDARVTSDMINLATLLMNKDELDKAHDLLARALAIRERHVDENHISLAGPLTDLALSERGLGRYQDSIAHCKRALAILTRVLKPGKDIAQVQLCLGRAYLEAGRYRDAVQQMTPAVKTYETAQPYPGLLDKARFDLARALVHLPGRRKEALALAKKARDNDFKVDPHSEQLPDFDAWIKAHGG